MGPYSIQLDVYSVKFMFSYSILSLKFSAGLAFSVTLGKSLVSYRGFFPSNTEDQN